MLAGGNTVQLSQFSRLAMRTLMVMIPMLLSLTVHEFAHAWMARRLGDSTAERQGRLTLNPLVHADPLGSVLMPFGILLLNGLWGHGGTQLPFFGFARPTPVNPNAFVRSVSVRQGTLYVAAAGPAANLCLAMGCALLLGGANRWFPQLAPALVQLLEQMVRIGVGVGLFNLLPLQPLDGHTIVASLLSPRHAATFAGWSQSYAMLGMLVVMFFAGPLLLLPIAAISGWMFGVVGL
jgi:Zn-dependent protease